MSGIPAGAGALLGKRLGKYEILALLALGGTAEIYLARIGGAAGFEKYVVVKCLHDHLADDAEFVKMFLDEARLAAYLDHSNIVQTMELGEHEGRYYMVMEFLAGVSLAMVVRRVAERTTGGRIPVPLALNMVAQACAGLHYAHERNANGRALNIVHRDISPQNLVISFEGVVKVVDFGIAKAEMRETRTRSGTIKGKFAYMSPEQCVANNVDRRTDVFAAGVILHELLVGKRLFKKPSPYETYQAVIECAVPPPSTMNVELDPALDPIVMRAVAKDKEERFPTAEAFGDAILSYLHHRGKGSGPGDVGRYFDTSFATEIDEHAARMRELIAGREFSVDTNVSWGDDAEEDKAKETQDFKKVEDKSFELASSDIDLVSAGQSVSGLSDVIDDLGDNRSEDDEIPAEKTRIEANPLEKINELEAAVAAAAQRKQTLPPSGALPLPPAPTGPMRMSTDDGDRKTPQPRFSEAANLPTVVSDSGQRPAPELAATELGQPIGPYPGPPGPNPLMVAPVGTPGGVQPAMMPPPPGFIMGPPMPQPGPPMMQPMAPHQMAPHPMAPQSYPKMSAELGAQISPQLANKLNVHIPQAPREPSAPIRPSYPDMMNPQHAMNMMSPVGQHYPQDVDWAAAAAKPVRAFPPWMLALLFLGALGIALLLTVAIVSAFR
jgi:serine/threonine protein kinase